MNLFEAEIQNFERRIRRIDEHSDPSRMKSNRLLYEICLDHRKQQLRAWQEGKPFLYFSSDTPRLFLSMGIDIVHPNRTGDRAYFRAKQYLDLGRSLGYPANACDRIVIQLAIAVSGDLPPPAFTVCSNGGCNSSWQAAIAAARHVKRPLFMIDQPRDNTYESIRYVTSQFRDLIRAIETTVPGTHFDEAKLLRLQERDKAVEHMRDRSMEIRKIKPCPIGGKDALRLPPLDIDHPRLIEYAELAWNELQQRVERGVGALAEEKMRVYWLVTAPFFTDLFAFLASRGVATPLYEVGTGTPRRRRVWDDSQYGRHLTPLEEEAAEMITRAWSGAAEDRVDEVLSRCREFDIDALVHCEQPGCVNCLGSSRILAERAEQELGIPSLYLDLACQDVERFDQQKIERQIADFIDVCLAKKAASREINPVSRREALTC